MQVGFDPFAFAVSALALALALWERRKRRMRERLKVRACIDVDDDGELSIRLDLTNREVASVFPDTFSIVSGATQHTWALGLQNAAIHGIPSGKHWRHYIPFSEDPTEPYRWTLRLQDGRAISGSGHQVAEYLRTDRSGFWWRLKGTLGAARRSE